jgi:hypothetical protein
MVTGLDLKRLFEDKIDNSYSDYVSDPKMQRAFDNAFLRVIENKYRGLDTQKEFDELSELMVIDKTILINNNRFRTVPIPVSTVTTGASTVFTFSAEHNLIEGDTFTVSGVDGILTGVNQTHTATVGSITSSTVITLATASTGTATPSTGSATSASTAYDNMLSDYLHIMAMKCYMYDPDESTPVYKAYGGSPAAIEFFRPIRSRNKQYIHGGVFSGATGFAIVKQVSEFKYELYQATFPTSFSLPLTLTQAVADTINTIEVGEVSWAKYLRSDRRISQSGRPTVNDPRFNQHKNFMMIHPQTAVCTAVSVDYIRKPDVVIDVTDNVRDLSLFYSETLLNRLTDEAVKMFYQEVRDPNQYQVADREMLDNP